MKKLWGLLAVSIFCSAFGLGAAGADEPNKIKVGKLTNAQLRSIAETKMPDLNANDVDAAMHIVAGTARSMGVEVGA